LVGGQGMKPAPAIFLGIIGWILASLAMAALVT
jgi:hypothetical protein